MVKGPEVDVSGCSRIFARPLYIVELNIGEFLEQSINFLVCQHTSSVSYLLYEISHALCILF